MKLLLLSLFWAWFSAGKLHFLFIKQLGQAQCRMTHE